MTRRAQYPNSFATGTSVTGASLPTRASSSLPWSPVIAAMTWPARGALLEQDRRHVVAERGPARPLGVAGGGARPGQQDLGLRGLLVGDERGVRLAVAQGLARRRGALAVAEGDRGARGRKRARPVV